MGLGLVTIFKLSFQAPQERDPKKNCAYRFGPPMAARKKQKHLEFTFFYKKALSFHSRTTTVAYMPTNISSNT